MVGRARCIEPYFDQPFYVGFDVGGYELGFDPNADMADGPRTYFGIDDVQAVVDHFVSCGCTIHEPITETGDDIVVASKEAKQPTPRSDLQPVFSRKVANLRRQLTRLLYQLNTLSDLDNNCKQCCNLRQD